MTKLEKTLPKIISLLDQKDQKVYKKTDLARILQSNREIWDLSDYVSTKNFIDGLIGENYLRKVEMEFPSRKETRYIVGNITEYELANSIKTPSYFSHYSAIFIHHLTEQIPKTIYVNQEQSKKPRSSSSLEQSRIDNAFRQIPRITNNRAKFRDFTIVLLSGKFTNELGVITTSLGPNQLEVRTTSIERTLIDICVRPFYAGGIFEVAKAFSMARNQVSIQVIANLLKELDYIYPYHQAIGFYMENAGYPTNELNLLREEFPFEFDFYLTHQIKNLEYSSKWRLFYPKGF